ncbi:MAG: CorA family divalent cation transporter, partial [Rubricella sp.]
LDDPRPDERRDIIAARRRVIMLRRYLAPQRDALSAMAGAEVGWFSRQDRDSLRLSIDRLARFVEDLEALRDRAQVVDDELGAALSERLNRNLYVLSVISAIFLPLGFITGLLGINVGGIPGAESGIAFWLVAGGLAFLGLGGVALFRLLRWL